MKLLTSLLITLFALSACSSQSPDHETERASPQPSEKFGRVMIIGLDGTRSDGIQQANTPNIDALIAEGAVDYNAITGDISFSGPGWASMLTGVWCDKHGVIDNDASWNQSKFDEYPHFVQRLESARPAAVTFSVSHWNPINDEILCAPERNDNCGDADHVKNVDTDLEVKNEVVNALENLDVEVVFMQFDDIDHAGHGDTTDGGSDPGGFCPYALGLGETDGACNATNFNQHYLDVIETTDGYIGEIMAALKARPNYADENWLVLSSPDHGGGGFIFNQHGHPGAQDRRTFFIASGDAADSFPEGMQTKITDIAATALHHLGIEIDPAWGIDGKPIAHKTAPDYTESAIPECVTGSSTLDVGR